MDRLVLKIHYEIIKSSFVFKYKRRHLSLKTSDVIRYVFILPSRDMEIRRSLSSFRCEPRSDVRRKAFGSRTPEINFIHILQLSVPKSWVVLQLRIIVLN